MLNPTSLITGLTGHVVGKVRDHVLSLTKAPPTVARTEAQQPDDCETTTETETTAPPTTKRPTLIDFMAKFKTKRSIHSGEADCGCSGKVSIADGIAEHVVDKVDRTSAEFKTGHDDELDEALSHRIQSRSARAKRSNGDDKSENDKKSQSEAFSYKASPFGSAPSKRPSCLKSSGTCDHIVET